MFKAIITSKGFEETVKEQTVKAIHTKLLDILQKLNIDFMPHHLGTDRKLQRQYKSIVKGDWKYLIAGKSIIQISK